MPLPTQKVVELAGFIKEKKVDALLYQKPYFLVPYQSDQAYWLFYHALKKSGKVGIARFAHHTREHLALVRPARGMLSLCTLYYPEEIRDARPAATPKPDAKQLQLALSLIEQQTIPFEPEAFKDRYREAPEAVLESKRPVEGPVSPKVADLLEALKRSIERAQERNEQAG